MKCSVFSISFRLFVHFECFFKIYFTQKCVCQLVKRTHPLEYLTTETMKSSTNATRIAFCQALDVIPNDVKRNIWDMIPGPPPFKPQMTPGSVVGSDDWFKNEWGGFEATHIDFSTPDEEKGPIWFPSEEDPEQVWMDPPPNTHALDSCGNPLCRGDLVFLGDRYARIESMDYCGLEDRSMVNRKYIDEWGYEQVFADWEYQMHITSEDGWEMAHPDEVLRYTPIHPGSVHLPIGDLVIAPRNEVCRDINGNLIRPGTKIWFGNFHQTRVRTILYDDWNGFIVITGKLPNGYWDTASNVQVVE